MKKQTNKRKIAIAIDLGGTNIRGALVSRAGKILFRHEVKTATHKDRQSIINQIVHLVELLTREAKSKGLDPISIGLGVPGFLITKKEKIVHSPNLLALQNISLGAQLRPHFSIPLILENDGNCHALGEWWTGAAKGFHHVIAVTLGTGVGGGIIVEDRLLRGSRGAGGEIGHIRVSTSDRPCGCGGTGCLETLVSGTALEQITGKSVATLCDEAKNHNTDAVEIFHTMGYQLGIALSSLCFLFDPEIVVLGGKVSRAYPYFSTAMKNEFQSRLRNHPARITVVTQGKHLDNTGLIGAAYLVFQNRKLLKK